MSKDTKFLLFTFISWRIFLFILLFLAISTVPLQMNFLGGGLQNYLSKPYFWAWANFDGEHYLSIAQNGYGFGEQAFFPAYPFLMRALASPIGKSLAGLNWLGILISNVAFFAALVYLYKLIRLDYSKKIARLSIALLLLFPTSFYFGSVYTESLFLALVVSSFYSARKNRWFLAVVLGATAAATRFVGILMLPVLALEFWIQRGKKLKVSNTLLVFLVPVGLLFYMYYLKVSTGDPLAFIHTLSGFGEQRSTTPIILPQVFYRYFFKILPNVNYEYFPVAFTTFLELLVGIVFLVVSVLTFFRLRLSYAVYLAAGYLIPTLSGSFSSLPRYVLVLFPAFILAAKYISGKSKVLQILAIVILFILLGIATSLFVRGYWVS